MIKKQIKDWSLFSSEILVIETIVSFATGFILMFGFYVQFHGEIAPGGGFQSGIVFAVAFIFHDVIALVYKKDAKPIISTKTG